MGMFFNRKDFICENCGKRDTPNKMQKGSLLIEIILWLIFIIPGLIYSFWRMSTKFNACPSCKKDTMIPIDSPKGQKLLKEYSN